MSVFRDTTVTCPACGADVPFRAVHSVNADRRPDLRAAILGETFQRQPCPACAHVFRLAPDLNYLDVGRGQWFAAHPIADVDRWPEIEARDRAAFDRAYGPAAPPPARAIGSGLRPRITFGWAGLREKILAAEHEFDDVTLELLKIAIVRGLDDAPLRDDTELRLVSVDGPKLTLAWIELLSEQVAEVLEVPWEVFAEIDTDTAAWAALREQLSAGLYVDMNRLLVPAPAPAAPRGPISFDLPDEPEPAPVEPGEPDPNRLSAD